MQPMDSQINYTYQMSFSETVQAIIKDQDKIMSPQCFADAMQTIMTFEDTECGHIHADDLMCYLLRQLGYSEGVDVFENADKWYS